MTYSVGGTIQASDINAWLNTINSVYGVGSGDRGYGQTSLQSNISAGNTITGSHWKNLRTMISRCAVHQGTSSANLVPDNRLDASDTIYAHVNSTAPNNYDIGTLVGNVDTNRLTASAGMALTSAAHSETKNAAWSTSTAITFDAVFGSEDAARYFFNTGGEIRVRLEATGTLAGSGAAQDVDWRDIITNKVGTMTVKARSTARSGSQGVIQNGGGGSQGFYGMNGTLTTVYNGANIGSGAYASNDVTLGARVLNVGGVNGGNGNTVRFTLTCSDQHTNGFYDSVSSGMRVVVDYYKVNTTNLPVTVAAPTFSTISNWS